MSYLPIGQYGVIGDLHTAVLIGTNGSIDWCCLPRFDSPSVFAALLDDERGGYWQIRPVDQATSEQRYLPGTNVLQTVFHLTEGGVLDVTDFMPVGSQRGGRCRIFRRVRAVRGAPVATVRWEPRFDYGRQTAVMVVRAHGVLATDRLHDVATIASSRPVNWEVQGGVALAVVPIPEQGEVWFVQSFDDDEVETVDAGACDELLKETIHFWDSWVSLSRYQGPFRKEVERSALALKLCCYEPSGAIVAAPTTSLPESYSGGRNWDYRFTWLRDSTFVLHALDGLGYDAETTAFLHFLKRVCRREGDGPLPIMYAVDAKPAPTEQELAHLRGYRGIGPVRIGNDAVGQFQLDVYGEVLDTMELALRRRDVSEGLWKVVRHLADATVSHWRHPDCSIWEPRCEERHHVFSKVMAWAGLDRAARVAERTGHPDAAQRWRQEADEVRSEVLSKGWDATRQTFVQAYGELPLDASLLAIPKVRFLERNDPRVRSTLEAVRNELATSCEELFYRYRSFDGLQGDEGAFVQSSLWVVQNLALIGEVAEADRLFRNLLRRIEPLGLAAEEIEPGTGDFLGNYPQALSHAAIINTALILQQSEQTP